MKWQGNGDVVERCLLAPSKQANLLDAKQFENDRTDMKKKNQTQRNEGHEGRLCLCSINFKSFPWFVVLRMDE